VTFHEITYGTSRILDLFCIMFFSLVIIFDIIEQENELLPDLGGWGKETLSGAPGRR
jgi:hypothetical protein